MKTETALLTVLIIFTGLLVFVGFRNQTLLEDLSYACTNDYYKTDIANLGIRLLNNVTEQNMRYLDYALVCEGIPLIEVEE
jgi:hypothetical protein